MSVEVKVVCFDCCTDPSSAHQARSEKEPIQDRPSPSTKNEKLADFTPENTFLPLKNVRRPGMSDTDTNWSMSGLRARAPSEGTGETFDFPHYERDGAKNASGLFCKISLPQNAIFVVDNNRAFAWAVGLQQHLVRDLGARQLRDMAPGESVRVPGPIAALPHGRARQFHASMGGWITHVLQAEEYPCGNWR